MSTISLVMWIVWGGSALALTTLLIYRGCLTLYEEDSMFLEDSSSHHRDEYKSVVSRVNRIEPWVKIFGSTAAVMTAALGIFYMVDSVIKIRS